MRKTYRIYQVDAFTTQRFTGNPAGVVPDASGLTETQMQAIARELNNSETAFIFPPMSSDHDVWIRFFTGILPVEIGRNCDDLEIIMTQGGIAFEKNLIGPQKDSLCHALGIDQTELDARCPVQIVSTGHSKVMVGLKECTTLNSLKPNLAELARLSRVIDCNGYFVFTLNTSDKALLAEGRMFAPAIGINEDPVTGNANGPLGAYLVHHHLVEDAGNQLTFYVKQGEAIRRPGKVRVCVDIEGGEPVKVRVAGRAVVAFRTEMEIG